VLGSGTILFIDSDPEQNNLNQCIFYPRGFTVLTATTIAHARRVLIEHEPDIIMMEAILPDGDGFEFIKELRSITDASIVFLTYRAGDKDVIEGLNLGASDYIKKPFYSDLLVARVDLAMRNRNKGQRAEARSYEF